MNIDERPKLFVNDHIGKLNHSMKCRFRQNPRHH